MTKSRRTIATKEIWQQITILELMEEEAQHRQENLLNEFFDRQEALEECMRYVERSYDYEF